MAAFNILSLDGGGAKGVYSLGVLRELEATLAQPLHEHFQLIYGTSTGAIIAALLALGRSAHEISDLYLAWLPEIFSTGKSHIRSETLRKLGQSEIPNASFNDVQTGLGIVTTDCSNQRPKIFKSNPEQAFSRKSTFDPGFGVPLLDALLASAAAIPFFEPVTVSTSNQGTPVLVDGGFVANNPTQFAITDALGSLGQDFADLKVLSVGTGGFSDPKSSIGERIMSKLAGGFVDVNLFQKSFSANANSIDWNVDALFPSLRKVRVDTKHPEHTLGMLTGNTELIKQGHTCGRDAFGIAETDIKALFES